MELSILKYPFSYEILNLRSLKFQTNLRSRHFLAHVFHILLFILLPIPFTFVSYLSFSSRFSAPTIRLILPSIYHSIPFPSFFPLILRIHSIPPCARKPGQAPSPLPLPFSKWSRKKNARGILLSPQTRSIILSSAQIRYNHNHSIFPSRHNFPHFLP